MHTSDLLEQLRQLPMRPSTVSHLLVVLDDPGADARDVAAALQVDPSLTARVLHLANAPAFGLAGKITSVERAVVALGASVVRSLAVSTAAGLFGARADEMPPGFWEHSITVAAGASVAARACGQSSGDALCAGLLHDLGAALVFRLDPGSFGERFGEHPAVGALALEAWKLPCAIVDALRTHHAPPLDVGGRLGRVVIAGEALARAAVAEPPFAHEPAVDPAQACAALGMDAPPVDSLLQRTVEAADSLDRLLQPG